MSPHEELNQQSINCVSFAVGKRSSSRPFFATCLTFSPYRDDVFMVGGQDALHVWNLDFDKNKLTQSAVNLGKIKRNITSLMVSCSTIKTILPLNILHHE